MALSFREDNRAARGIDFPFKVHFELASPKIREGMDKVKAKKKFSGRIERMIHAVFGGSMINEYPGDGNAILPRNVVKVTGEGRIKVEILKPRRGGPDIIDPYFFHGLPDPDYIPGRNTASGRKGGNGQGFR